MLSPLLLNETMFNINWTCVYHLFIEALLCYLYIVTKYFRTIVVTSLIPKYVPARALRSSLTLSICVPPRKTTIATSKSFSSVASNIWNSLPNHLSSIPTLPAFIRALKHHLFLLAYPDSSAKSGKIKPAQCITLRDTPPTTAIAQPRNTMPPI